MKQIIKEIIGLVVLANLLIGSLFVWLWVIKQGVLR